MEHKFVSLASFKMVGDGPGGFEGYASRFGIKDDVGDIVVRGAYADTLPQFIENGFHPVGHNWESLPVGYITDAYEDDAGLFIKGTYHSTQAAQDARTVAMERLAAGKSVGLSIGYEINPEGKEQTPTARLLTSLTLYEVSFVTVPALRSAGMTAVKSKEPAVDPKPEPKPKPDRKLYLPLEIEGSYEDIAEDINEQLREMIDTPWGYQCGWVIATFPGHAYVQVYQGDDNETTYWDLPYTLDADGDPVLGTPSAIELVFMPAAEAEPVSGGPPFSLSEEIGFMGTTYAAHAGRVLGAAKGFVERSKLRLEKRAKEGRVLSTVNRGTLAELRDAAKTILDQIENMLDATDPEREKALDADALYREFQRIVAQQNGVAA